MANRFFYNKRAGDSDVSFGAAVRVDRFLLSFPIACRSCSVRFKNAPVSCTSGKSIGVGLCFRLVRPGSGRSEDRKRFSGNKLCLLLPAVCTIFATRVIRNGLPGRFITGRKDPVSGCKTDKETVRTGRFFRAPVFSNAITMKQALFFFPVAVIVWLFVLFPGCRQENHSRLLSEAEAVLDKNLPDSAFQLLRRIHKPDFCGEEQARYALAFTRAMFDTGYRDTTDSLILSAVGYYREKADSGNYSRALYWAALVNFYRNRWERADSFLQAAFQASPPEDFGHLFQICRWRGVLAINRQRYGEALSAFHRQRSYADRIGKDHRRLFCMHDLARTHRAAGNPDSALFYYRQGLDLYRSNREYWNLANFFYDAMSQIYLEKKDFRNALETARAAKEIRNNRDQVPVANLTIARIYLSAHRLDSARHYLKKATQSLNPYVATVGYDYLMQLDMARGEYEDAYYDFLNYQACLNSVQSDQANGIDKKMYREEKLKNENSRLELLRKEQQAYILLLCVFLLLAVLGGYIAYSTARKKRLEAERKVTEAQLQEEARRLENENLFLKQQQELSQLREKAAELRESLFRKLPVVRKIPSLDPESENPVAKKPESRISLTEDDWNELLRAIDETYGNFVQRLSERFPELTRQEIAFCCLLKIKVTMQDLSDIYCISKAGITKKKTRLKNEKMHLHSEEATLDEFIQNF